MISERQLCANEAKSNGRKTPAGRAAEEVSTIDPQSQLALIVLNDTQAPNTIGNAVAALPRPGVVN